VPTRRGPAVPSQLLKFATLRLPYVEVGKIGTTERESAFWQAKR